MINDLFVSIISFESLLLVQDYKNGKTPVIMFLVGQVMRKAGKKINAQMVKEKLETKLQ